MSKDYYADVDSGLADSIKDSGVGGGSQTLSDLTGQRAADVQYLNDTANPIALYLILSSTAVSQARILIDGVAIYSASASAGTQMALHGVIVPAGSTYLAQVTAGTGSVLQWQELR